MCDQLRKVLFVGIKTLLYWVKIVQHEFHGRTANFSFKTEYLDHDNLAIVVQLHVN